MTRTPADRPDEAFEAHESPTARANHGAPGAPAADEARAAPRAVGEHASPGHGGHGDKAPPSRPVIALTSTWAKVRRIVVLSWDSFWADRCTTAASSLAYQSALALVPLVAVGLALLKASGQLDAGSELLNFIVQQIFPSSAEARAEVVKSLSSFSDKIAAGALGSFGLVTSLGVGFFLFLSVEDIWNRIWESQRERTYVERFLLFYTGITLLPFIAAVSFLHTAALWRGYGVLRQLLSLGTTVVVLTLANRLLPTLNVRWRPAFVGGLTSAILLELAKVGLGLYLSFVTGSYRSIYGALGVLPLFLLSIYLAWFFILWGVEVSRAAQRLPLLERMLEPGSRNASKLPTLEDAMLVISGPLAARLLCDVARNFKQGQRALPILEIEQRHGLPESVVRRVLKRLEKAGLVIEHEDGYMLARPPDAIRLYDVLRLFQPPRHYYAQAEPDALDQVLNQLDLTDQEQTQSITFASLI